MDEDSETTQDIPEFIRNAIKQLISLKSNISTVDNFHNDIKKKNVNVDMIDFANKVKDFLNTLNTTVTDVNSAFLISLEAFINENKVTNKNTGKINSDIENVNTDLGDNLLQKDKADDSVNSNSDAAVIEKTDELDKNSSKQKNSDSDKKSSKQKNSEISDLDKNSSTQKNSEISDSDKKSSKQKNSEIGDSDVGLRTSKLRKKRRKAVSSSRISENGSTDSDSTGKNTDISNKMIDDNIEFSDTDVHNSKINEKIVHKVRKTSEVISDSDKENAKNEKIKELMKETNKKLTSELNNNSDSEKELSSKTHKKKSKKVVQSDNETDSSTKKLKDNEKKQKLGESTTDCDLDSDNKKSKSVKAHKKSKVTCDSNTEYPKTDDNHTECNTSDSITKNLKAIERKKLWKSTNFFDSDSDLDSDSIISKTTNKRNKKNIKSNDGRGSDADNSKTDRKLVEPDNESDSSVKKLKESEKKKKFEKSTNFFDSESDLDSDNIISESDLDSDNIISKTANKRNNKNNKSNDGRGTDADNPKKDSKLVESDNESVSSVRKLKENENKKKLEERTDKFDSDVDFDSGSSKCKSAKETNKKSEKSKVVDKSDIDNPKKDSKLSESDNESDSNTKNLKESEKKKKLEESTKKIESGNDESDSDVHNKKSKASNKNKKFKVADNSDIDNPKKDNKLSESDNESNSNTKKIKETEKKKIPKESTKTIESDNDESDLDVRNKKSKASKNKKKSKVADNSDIDNPQIDNKLESDNESDSNIKKLKETEKKKKPEESTKKIESDNDDSDSDVPNKKSKPSKNKKKSKVADNSDEDNPKKNNKLSESDNESDSNTKKLKETGKKKKPEESTKKILSDNDESDSDVRNKKSKPSKNKKKSKVADNSDKDNPKKNNKLSESDNESDSNTKKLKETGKKKKPEESTKKILSDNDESDSDVRNKKSKTSKKNKKSKVTDNSDIDNPKKDNKLSESDNESDSNTKKLKETEKKKKPEESTKKIESDESDSDVCKKKSKASKKNKKNRKSESEFDVGQNDSDNETIDSSKKKEVINDSNTEDSKKDDDATENNSDSHKKKSKGRKKHKKNSKKSESESDIDHKESDKTNYKKDELEDTINEVNKTNSLDDDSDSYLEDPRIIIEKSKKALAEKKKSGLNTKSNSELSISKDSESTKTNDDLFDALKNNESNDTNSVDSNPTKNTKSKKDINKIGDKNDKKDMSDNTDSSVDNQNENCDQTTIDEAVSSENDIETNKDDENEKEEKPKIGFLKCIDINKLLDPQVAQKDEGNEVLKVNKAVSHKKNDSVIILSSSDSDCKMVENKKRPKTSKNKQKLEEKSKKVKKEDSGNDYKTRRRYDRKREKDSDESSVDRTRRSRRDRKKDSDESSVDRKRRLRFDRKKEKSHIAKQTFEQLRLARSKRVALQKSIKDNTSSSNESDSSTSSRTYQKKSVNDKKRKSKNQSFNIDPNYDYTKDIKFKVKCYVSLPKIPVEKLKEYYLQEQEDAEIKRLTNMNSLKRTRNQKGATSSSDSDVKKDKKRTKTNEKQTKLQQRKKKIDIDDEDGQTEHSDNESHMSDESIINTEDINKKDANPPIPDDILESDKDISNGSSDDEDEDKKKSKNGNKKKSDKKNVKEKTKNDMEENSKDSEKQKEDTEKSKWRNDPLLRGKLDASDSEEELIRFRNKKNKIADDIKSKTKKQIKRMARRLGSDVSSSEDEKEDKSDSEKENSAQSSSSDSEEEQNTKKKPVRRRIKRVKDSDESTDGEERAKRDKKKKKDEEEESTRKKIRNVWSKDSLAESTKEAVKEEEERKKRIADKQKLYNEIYDNKLDLNAKVDKVILDFNEETKEELLSVHTDLVAKLKPHQAKGVQFMWTACFESLERAKSTEGSGCILAHCMGLGKTLQVIALIHTLLTNTDETNVQTVLVVCPLSTVLNWVSEFKKWLDDLDGEQVNVFDLVHHKQNYERLYQMQDWMKFGGVLVIGYDMFRNLSNPKGKRMSKKLANGFNKVLLEPGPDLVVCDEGHLLKNEKTGISIAMNKLRTKRRIVLTGTPLQNNLKEYFCMVHFVKPSLLGTYKEYLNRFVNPITNGQYTDSTPHDIQIMRRRAHVLHKMLDAVVERRDYNVLAPFLPPKHEFVLFITLTPCQIDLYREYLTKFSRNTEVKGTSYLFQDFQELQRICIHPRVLLDKSNQDKLRRDNLEDDDSEGSLKDFINDDDTEKSTTADESSDESGSDSNKKASVSTRRTRANPGGHAVEEPEPEAKSDEWWSKFCQADELDNIDHSSKIKLLFDILHQCEMIGDKVLVFSQSLYSLNLIEYFLSKIDEATQSGDTVSSAQVGGYTGSWALGLDYFRLDGSTSCENRATWCKTFNNEANTRARLFLISTRAGGLGINLVAANRVIVFDVSWNPSYDIQSIYRVYRFGQTKPCYIYRFVTLGTMENKIYERQVTKQAISKRVIDEQQIDRHYNQTDLAELYAFNPIPDEERPIPLVPKDRLFADLLQSHEKYIFKYHEHNSLLEDKADEGLNEEERRAAWEEFENEKTAPKFNLMQTMVRNGMFETLRILVQEDNSGWTPAQINNILPMIVQRISEQVTRGDYSMYRRVEERHELRVLEQRRMQMIYQQYMQQLRNAPGGGPMTPADINKLAQMISTYNQNLMQPRPQVPSSSAALATFRQGDPPPQMVPGPPSAPIPHPAVNEVVELND